MDLEKLAHHHNLRIPTPRGRVPVCARCLGIYGGMLLWTAILVVSPAFAAWIRGLGGGAGGLLSFGLTVPLVVDWWSQCRGWRHSTNLVRVLTGLGLSLGLVTTVVQFSHLYVTGPLMAAWAYLVLRLGRRWRIRRPPYWGCSECETGTLGEYTQRRLDAE